MSQLPPPRRPKSAKSSKKRKRKKSAGSRTYILMGVAAVAVVGLGIGGFFLFNRGSDLINDLGQALGVSDTALSLSQELHDIEQDYLALGRSIQDQQSAEAALDDARDLLSRVRDVELRAAGAPLATAEQWQEVETWKRGLSGTNGPGNDVRIPLTSDQMPDELEAIVFDMTFRLSSADSLIKALREPPAPQNEYEEIEVERIRLNRDALRALLSAESTSEISQAVSELNRLSGLMAELTQRKTTTETTTAQVGMAESRYMNYRAGLTTDTAQNHLHQLSQSAIDVTSLNQAWADFSSADSNYQFARAGRAGAPSPGGGMPPFGGPNPSLVNPNPGDPPAGGRPSFGGMPNNPLTRPAGEQEVIVFLLGGDFGEGGWTVPQVFEMQGQMMPKIMEITTQIDEIAAARSGARGVVQEGCVVRVSYAGTAESLADQFSFGERKDVDETNRTIRVYFSAP